MKVYKASSFDYSVEEVESIKETDKSIWIKNYREEEVRISKTGTYANYFDSFEEAKVFLLDKINREINAAKSRLSKFESYLEKLEN